MSNPLVPLGNERGCSSCCTEQRQKDGKRIAWSLLVGQTLAVLLGLSGTCTALLASWDFSLPFAQNLPYFFTLMFIYNIVRLSVHFRRTPKRLMERPHPELVNPKDDYLKRIVLFVSMGVILVHSLWATVTAYAYTNLTSIQLLDCMGIPTAMILSFLVLRHRYSWTHYVGAIICIAGAALMIGADLLTSDKTEHLSKNVSTKTVDHQSVLIGDILALVGGVLYGAYSVLQEYAITNYGTVSSLANLSVVTSVMCGFYCAIMEHSPLTELLSANTLFGKSIPTKVGFCLAGYACAMFALDTLMAFTISWVSAVTINLSLLTADVYGLVVGIFLFKLKFHYLYFIAFASIIVGLVIFSIRPARVNSSKAVSC